MNTKDNYNHRKHGILNPKMKSGRYCTKSATPNLIRYISRGKGSSKASQNDLLCFGAYGAIDFLGVNAITKQFNQVSSLNTRNASKNRYIDHEIFSFSEATEKVLLHNPQIWRKTCSDMASILSDGQHQVAYALHMPDGESQHLHVHFAVNTVNFTTGLKRQENRHRTGEHQKKLNSYLEDNLI